LRNATALANATVSCAILAARPIGSITRDVARDRPLLHEARFAHIVRGWDRSAGRIRAALGQGAQEMSQKGESERAAPRPSPLVLVVDDFEDNRAMYAEYLAYSGYSVEQAADGEEAVKLAQHLLPDIVVMDLSLPIMDGWEATRRLKADERTRRIPVIALTGHALASHSRGAREAGCDAFLAKPCLPEKLVEKVEELIHPKIKN
jgi:CheY-like chemotaxis protein